MRSKLWILLAVLFSLGISAGLRAAEMEDKEKGMDEKEKRRRATLRAAGIDPDAGKKAAPAPMAPASAPSAGPAGKPGSYTFTITGMM
jgi:hypothetical protein